MPSALGYKADDWLVSCRTLIDHFNDDLKAYGSSAAYSDAMSKSATEGALRALAPSLSVAKHWATFASAATGVVALTTTFIGADAMSYFKKIAFEINKSLKGLCEAAEVSTNLTHTDKFPQWVYDFVSDEVSKAAAGEDLEAINTAHLLGLTKVLGNAKSTGSNADEKQAKKSRPQYFFVYHPGNDWHATFNSMLRENPIPGLIGVTNNLNTLSLFLDQFRAFVGPEAIINILFPSAHVYVIADDITVAEGIHPLRLIGQAHRSGNPYVYVCAKGIDAENVKDIGLMTRPTSLSAGQKVGIAAGGIGAGIGGAVAGSALFLGVAVLGAVVAGPVIVAGAAAEAVIIGGTAAGFLGGGAAAGTVCGINMTKDAQQAMEKKQVSKKK